MATDLIMYMRQRLEDQHLQLAQAEQKRDEYHAEVERLREQVATVAAELERLHVGLSRLQDGMPDYLDEAVQALIDNEPPEGDD